MTLIFFADLDIAYVLSKNVSTMMPDSTLSPIMTKLGHCTDIVHFIKPDVNVLIVWLSLYYQYISSGF